MKKIILALSFLGISSAAMAANYDPTENVLVNESLPFVSPPQSCADIQAQMQDSGTQLSTYIKEGGSPYSWAYNALIQNYSMLSSLNASCLQTDHDLANRITPIT